MRTIVTILLFMLCVTVSAQEVNNNTYTDDLEQAVNDLTSSLKSRLESRDWNGVVETGVQLADIFKTKKKEETEGNLFLIYSLILAYHNLTDYTTESTYFDEFERLCDIFEKRETELYWEYLILKAEALTNLYNEEDYRKTIAEQNALTKKLYGEYSYQSALTALLDAQHYQLLDKLDQASLHVAESWRILESGKCNFRNERDSLVITSHLHNINGSINLRSDSKLAEDELLKSLEEFKATGQSPVAVLINLGMLYLEIRRDYSKALEYFLEANDLIEKTNTNLAYLTLLNNIALCFQNLGDSSSAVAIYDMGEQMAKEYYNEHPICAYLQQNISNFYAQLTDYPKAIDYCKEALKSMERVYGIESEKYADCLSNLGMLYNSIGNYAGAKEYLLKAQEILKKLQSRHVIYTYTNLLNVYSAENDLVALDKTIREGLEALTRYQLDKTDLSASFALNAGYVMLTNGHPSAKGFLNYALTIMRQNGNQNSADYLGATILYYISTFTDKSYDESITSSLINQYKDFYLSNVVYYNSIERESFVTSARFSLVKDIVFSARHNNENDAELYDYLLFKKGLLLGTSISYAKTIYNSGNEELISQYAELVKINRFLSGETTSSIDCSLEEAKARASFLERDLTLYLRQNGSYTDELSYTCADVKEALSDHEMAVEFVSYQNYLDNCTDYAALVLMKGFEKPRFIKLGKAEEIEKFSELTPVKIYSESTVSQELYNKIWSPIISMFPSVKKIIFSPTGVLNKLAIEQLYNGKKRVCESRELVRVTSTREICRRPPQYKYASAVLYGGLKYDEDLDTMIAQSRRVRGNNVYATERFRGNTSTTTRSGWNYLPGTLSEVNEVSSIISKGNVKHSLYSAVKGNEESFKALSGSRFDILHIATHGFYLSESQASKSDYFASNPFMTINTTESISSLYRSGLMLSGGNKAWVGETIPNGIEDGILTAAEIANLDFNSCDIVVLSACETGLGEITDEGVFGLQRSFKIAGVNTIIMSLWEVDDQATSYMMQNFYKNLVKGKTKREAFTIAQAEVKKKYSDPKYWAAFIMLD